jgi:hypothetical protein
MAKEPQSATELRILAVLADCGCAGPTATEALRGCVKSAHGLRVLEAIDELAKAKKGGKS